MCPIFLANCSFAHLSWVTWANCSWSLICHERPEQFAHGHSFVLSDLSDSLTVAHLSWAIWANRSQSLIWFEQNERLSNEQIREFPALMQSRCKSYSTLIQKMEKEKKINIHTCRSNILCLVSHNEPIREVPKIYRNPK